EITLITEEAYPPYRRLSLTKQAWSMPFDSMALNTEKQGVNVVTGVRAESINETEKTVEASDGKIYPYDRLLIATGISPRKFPYEGPVYLRTYRDFEILKGKLEKGKRVLVIGAGFTGLELSGELRKQGCDVTIIFPEELPCLRFLLRNLCAEIGETMKKNGIVMLNSDMAEKTEYADGEYRIITKSGKSLSFDVIVASIGNIPNIPFSDKIVAENGIAVNKYMETNIPDVYAAGDVAQFYSPVFDMTMRREFMDNAIKGGKCAASNMCGIPLEYSPVLNTFFDVFDVGYKAVGEYSANMDVSMKEIGEGSVVFYRKDNVIQGILFWKVKPSIPMAVKCIQDKLTLSDEEYLYMMKYL
ncbi:MAG: FAD-dependent oxidoreductase, partial [Armatimonadetes bacterium]|nr:FAD-dependent oxidoreductase [Candidatus Hippobium faecium]